MSAAAIKRISVRRYRDNRMVVAYVEWADGTRTEGQATFGGSHHRLRTGSFGLHMHSLFARAKRDGLTMQRETW